VSSNKVTNRRHVSEIGNDGIITNVNCPSCGKRIIYNGNYFCEDWGYVSKRTRYGGDCSWALPHPATSATDRAICDALCVDYE
jgi:hypothetical protein